jgi:hypothetical protein
VGRTSDIQGQVTVLARLGDYDQREKSGVVSKASDLRVLLLPSLFAMALRLILKTFLSIISMTSTGRFISISCVSDFIKDWIMEEECGRWPGK